MRSLVMIFTTSGSSLIPLGLPVAPPTKPPPPPPCPPDHWPLGLHPGPPQCYLSRSGSLSSGWAGKGGQKETHPVIRELKWFFNGQQLELAETSYHRRPIHDSVLLKLGLFISASFHLLAKTDKINHKPKFLSCLVWKSVAMTITTRDLSWPFCTFKLVGESFTWALRFGGGKDGFSYA